MNTNKKIAIASLVGSLFFPLASIIGAIVSLVRGNKNRNEDNGFGFALAALIVGFLNFMLRKFILFTLVILPLIGFFGATMNGGGMNHNGFVQSDINKDCNNLINDTDGFVSDEVILIGCQVIGMDEKSAVSYIEDNNLISRIASRDEEFFALTMDYRSNRINLHIVKGIVVDSNVG